MINLNKKEDLLRLLLKIEFSLYSPIAERKGKKTCPYCAQFEIHDKECELNNGILNIIGDNFTFETKEVIQETLEEIEWCGFNKICPCCQNQIGEGHAEDCWMKGVTDL
jgi:hypothetical protein